MIPQGGLLQPGHVARRGFKGRFKKHPGGHFERYAGFSVSRSRNRTFIFTSERGSPFSVDRGMGKLAGITRVFS